MSRFDIMAQEEFSRALKRGRFQAILSRLQLERSELLSFYDVKKLVKPKRQTYIGTRAIRVDQIIGSEGRFNDFSNSFMPKKMMLKNRWASINQAHRKMVGLPAISVYKLGSSYFVRDGNHRVSVARAMGVEYIDADIVELDSQIELKPGMTDRQIREAVVEYERKRVLKTSGIDKILDMEWIRFTEPGQYTEMLHHINVHKYYINMNQKEEISFEDAVRSWYGNVYRPIADAVIEQRLQIRFPGRSIADLYMWTVKHWNKLKDEEGQQVRPDDALRDFKQRYRMPRLKWLSAWLKNCFRRRG